MDKKEFRTLVSEEKLVERFSEIYKYDPEKVTHFKDGNENYTFLTEQNRVIRIYKPTNKLYKEIKKEINYLNYLNNKKVKVPKFLKSPKNKFVTRVEAGRYTFRAVQMSFLEGSHKRDLNLEELKSIGAELANFHRTSEKYKIFQSDEEEIRVFEDYYLEEDKIKEEDMDFYIRARDFNLKLGTDLKRIMIHGDFHPENILLKDHKVTGILDFDDMEVTTKVLDIAIFIWELFENAFGSENPLEKWNIDKESFLSSYLQETELSKEENDLILPLVNYRNYFIALWSNRIMNMNKEYDFEYFKKTEKLLNNI
ncbi:MAG: phosphotransferase [Candidatus Dojkabacteria bacterium]|nr:phosphotransferase [Candidatus Dojkabacteria bacterium]MDQ7021123.1 phosphotransferase [Candidatus Dojkabacteria bacterium]